MRSDRRRGQATVEFALVAAVLVTALATPIDGHSTAGWLWIALRGAARGFAAWLAVV